MYCCCRCHYSIKQSVHVTTSSKWCKGPTGCDWQTWTFLCVSGNEAAGRFARHNLHTQSEYLAVWNTLQNYHVNLTLTIWILKYTGNKNIISTRILSLMNIMFQKNILLLSVGGWGGRGKTKEIESYQNKTKQKETKIIERKEILL